MIRNIKFIIAAAIGLSLFSGTFSYAQSDAIKTAREEVVLSVKNLSDLQNSTLDPQKKALKEIELKRVALAHVLNLTTLETKDVSDKLNELILKDDQKIIALKKLFTGNIESSFAHVDTLKKELVTEVDINRLKVFAGDLKTWREAIYNPNMERTVSFVLVQQNKDALEIADLRLEKIDAAIKKMTDDQTKIEPIEALLIEAKDHMASAHKWNDEATTEILTYLPEEETINSEATTTPALASPALVPVVVLVARETSNPEPLITTNTTSSSTALSTEPVTEISATPANPRKLVESSAKEITAAYAKFIKISEMLKGGK